jgi:hypothetical protein
MRNQCTFDRGDSAYPTGEFDMADMQLQSVITCPQCGFAREETMPIDACIYYYECTACGELLRPRPGDCCVFCSYGSVACPPVQLDRDGCCAG